MKQKHQQFLLVLLLLPFSLGAWAQMGTALFPRMPRYSTFQPTLIRGELPPEGYTVKWIPVTIRQQPSWSRQGRHYKPLTFQHNGGLYHELHLRQDDSTVYAAIDAHIQQSDEAWSDSAWQKKGWTEAALTKLAQRDALAARELRNAMMRYENPLFKFNAKVGDKWKCFLGLRGGWSEYASVELVEVRTDANQQRLFQYAIGFSPSASHFPAMQRIVVSPERGIISMQWYEYQCWKHNCGDWIVDYTR